MIAAQGILQTHLAAALPGGRNSSRFAEPPIGEMAKWSQLRIYTEENVKNLLVPYGTITVFERHDDLLMVKLKFND